MTEPGLPNFWNLRAVVLHRRDQNYRALTGQLSRIGLRVKCVFPVDDVNAVDGDIVLFDADLCPKSLFPWSQGDPPIPLIAILGSEAPGPLERALSHMPAAFLQKPIGSTGVFNALVVAHHKFAEAQKLRRKLADLSERVRARPVVLRAIILLMRERRLSDTAALEALRRQAMVERTSIEALAAKLVTMSSALPMYLPTNKPPDSPPHKYALNKRGGY